MCWSCDSRQTHCFLDKLSQCTCIPKQSPTFYSAEICYTSLQMLQLCLSLLHPPLARHPPSAYHGIAAHVTAFILPHSLHLFGDRSLNHPCCFHYSHTTQRWVGRGATMIRLWMLFGSAQTRTSSWVEQASLPTLLRLLSAYM